VIRCAHRVDGRIETLKTGVDRDNAFVTIPETNTSMEKKDRAIRAARLRVWRHCPMASGIAAASNVRPARAGSRMRIHASHGCQGLYGMSYKGCVGCHATAMEHLAGDSRMWSV